MSKGFSNKKLAFYNSAKSEFNEKPQRYMSETNGFFNIRTNRNQSQMTSGNNSKSFSNYLRAKERTESIAKSYFEKQNMASLIKAKKQKDFEKLTKEMKLVKAD